ncbi:uncharacterized protein LOC116844322 isoform X2 [Odontomachus brunneus]|uniref:uncharacterized protein LOC116844322 isoform X2 n=1 Tax=Odontomachus brunneus TaxID=486640 RepID=UPI0013F276A4|nr:uncharacterized protein LOC116844322 isoform X2 [Odontomachus brunneus]
MDLHKRYLHFPTLDISVLRAINLNNKLENDIFIMPHHLLQFYNNEITKEKLNISKLEVYRMLLCYEFQQTFSEMEQRNDKKCMLSDVKTGVCFPNIETVFPAQHLRNITEMSILRDIIILQTVLYYNTISIKQYLQSFLNSHNAYITNSDTRAMYMKVLKFLLESLCLHRFSHNDRDSNKEELKEISSMYLEVMKSWMKMKEDSEWSVLASMLPMLVNTFVPEDILLPLWDYILNKMNDLKESLTVLSIMVDTCLTSLHSTKSTRIHCDIFCKDTFWLLLLEGLRSPLQQYRKQALYIMRRTTDFMSKGDNLYLESIKAEITPFICSKSNNSALPVDSIRQKFFLVYESLEEKQYHLVAPALTHVSSLVRASKEHGSCQCFNIVWLRCILEKALRHENNNIAKWSASYVCKLDGVVFDDQFLELFANVLNNSFLYEYQPDEDYPEIVKELSTFFRCTAKGETSLLNRFLRKVSEVTWGPVAIFYIMHALRKTSQEAAQHNWRGAELNAVKSLMETSLNMHSHVLRTASQIELLRAIPNFVREIDDLTLLANVLATFSLIREGFPWDVITAWLREVLAKEDAVAFVERTCARYSNKDLVPEVNPKTFAFMIFLLYDARVVLSCKKCPAENALSSWLSCLNSIEMRPYADIHSIIDVAEFISHLMDFYAQRKICNDYLIRLIMLHVHASFKFLIANVRKMATGLTLEDYTRYASIVSLHIINADLFMSRTDLSGYAEKLQEESMRLLRGTQHRESTQYLYGTCILHLSQIILILPSARIFYTEDLLDVRTISAQTSNQYDADMMNLKGKIASEYYLILSRMTTRYLLNTSVYMWNPLKSSEFLSNDHKCIPPAKVLTYLLKFVKLGGIEAVTEVALTLTILVNKKIIIDTNDWETFQYTFKSCWRCTFDSKRNIVFWTAVQNLTEVIINDDFLESRFDTTEFVTEFVDQLIKEGESASKFKRILLSRMERLNPRNLIKFEKPLLNCLLHGSVLRRDERVENCANLCIVKHLRQYFPKHILIMDHNNDAAVRALATILLHRTARNSATTVLPLIFEMLEKHKNKRYFNDSYIHKLKHRLMQILLILEPVMNEELVALLQKKLRDLILLESNQHSVRLMQEWLMIRILIKNSDLHNELWKFFTESIEKRPGCTVSVASIVYHVARLLTGASQKTFITIALPYVAQCCLSQQFNIRLYNQFILVRLYDLMKQTSDTDGISGYDGIYQAATASLQQASSTKNFTKIQDNFYFSDFHPIDDYSLQTIYFELPRLANVSCDEWISPDVFKDFEFARDDRHPLKLHNVNSLLSNTITSMYLTKSSANLYSR